MKTRPYRAMGPKTNQTPQHDTSRARCLTLTFGEGGVVQSFPRGLNNLSIYGISTFLGPFSATSQSETKVTVLCDP